jgi:hypothetical protein
VVLLLYEMMSQVSGEGEFSVMVMSLKVNRERKFD